MISQKDFKKIPKNLKPLANLYFYIYREFKSRFFDSIKWLRIDKNLSAEKIIHMDIKGYIEQIFAIGWCLATITEFYYSNKKT